MPITENNNQTLIEFGIGDIYMANYHLANSKIHHGVLIAQDVPGPIGKKIDTGREYSENLHVGIVIEEIKTRCVRLEFKKSESVTQLIGLLEGVREDLYQKEKKEGKK